MWEKSHEAVKKQPTRQKQNKRILSTRLVKSQFWQSGVTADQKRHRCRSRSCREKRCSIHYPNYSRVIKTATANIEPKKVAAEEKTPGPKEEGMSARERLELQRWNISLQKKRSLATNRTKIEEEWRFGLEGKKCWFIRQFFFLFGLKRRGKETVTWTKPTNEQKDDNGNWCQWINFSFWQLFLKLFRI